MKLYKCKVRITEVREGTEIMEAPSEALAKDPAWVAAAQKDTYLEELETIEERPEVVSIEEITHLGQVPPKWHDSLPWYHPTHEPSNQETIKERLAPEFEDKTAWVNDEIKQLENKKLKLETELKSLRALLAR